MAREPIPQSVLPEAEVFLGNAAISRHETPGSKQFAETILPFVQDTNIVILANHGTVSFGKNVEEAYWCTEMFDAYCRVLILAKQIGNIEFLSKNQTQELLNLKQKLGFEDARLKEKYRDCDICSNDIFRDRWEEAGVERRGFPTPQAPRENGSPVNSTPPASIDVEALVRKITKQVLSELQTAKPTAISR